MFSVCEVKRCLVWLPLVTSSASHSQHQDYNVFWSEFHTSLPQTARPATDESGMDVPVRRGRENVMKMMMVLWWLILWLWSAFILVKLYAYYRLWYWIGHILTWCRWEVVTITEELFSIRYLESAWWALTTTLICWDSQSSKAIPSASTK